MTCTVAEAARIHGVTTKTIRNWMKRGKIERVTHGACVIVAARPKKVSLDSFNAGLRRALEGWK